MLKGSKFSRIHDKEGYKFFCFSNIFPASDLKEGDVRHLLVSSPDSDFIKHIVSVFNERRRSGEKVSVGKMEFFVKKAEILKLSLKMPLTIITGTPIVIRIPKEKYVKFGIKTKYPYEYLYWRQEHPLELFIEQLENNLHKKYAEFTGETVCGGRIIERFRFRKQVSTRVFMKGLEQADWLTSAGEEPSLMKFPTKIIRDTYDYQDVAAATEGNIFIMLPTGTGKTETALYWAKKNAANATRMFYVLPTTTTINAMFERLRGLFGDIVGEYHSSVDLFLDIEGDSVSDEELQIYKYFFMPFNVTTPDQLLLSLMNYKKFALKSFSMKNSLMIFDEIHTYDAETFAMIKFLLQYLAQYYGTRFCIMSATFPDALRNELGFLSAKELISHDQVMKQYTARVRTRIRFIEDLLENHLDEICELVKRGKKVIVVLNTVKRAQDIYRTLKEKYNITDILLLHSRYTFSDRYNRESNLINQCADLPSLLVSTQVVEVSLNISYDVMYTESCHVDSLVQRAGRVNRFGRSKEPAMINVFKPKSHYPYQQDLLRKATDIIAAEQAGINSEWDYVRITNMFYNEIWDSIRNDSDERFYSIWDKTRYIFSADLSDEETQELLRTRSGMVSISAFPISLHETIQDIQRQIEIVAGKYRKMQLQREKRKYLVNVPLVKGITFTDDSLGKFVNKAYDEEYGIHDEEDNII
jgi:CRISPR-associated endonuclease/helicase Cas3